MFRTLNFEPSFDLRSGVLILRIWFSPETTF